MITLTRLTATTWKAISRRMFSGSARGPFRTTLYIVTNLRGYLPLCHSYVMVFAPITALSIPRRETNVRIDYMGLKTEIWEECKQKADSHVMLLVYMKDG